MSANLAARRNIRLFFADIVIGIFAFVNLAPVFKMKGEAPPILKNLPL